MNVVTYFIITVALWNIITFSLYGTDKKKAKRNKWRIKESTLIICTFIMGGIGALLGMCLFHHKTKHIKFLLLIPLAVIINLSIAAYCVFYFLV